MRFHVPHDFLERVPRPPSVDLPRLILPPNHECWETADPEGLAFVTVALERFIRGVVIEGADERVDIEARFLGDLRLDVLSVNAPSVEAPRLAEASEVPPSLVGALEVRGLRGDTGGPRRIEIVRRIGHRIRGHRHAMLARYGLEKGTHG